MSNLKDAVFHLNEFAICGHSNTGKTTLIERLIKKYTNENFNVGVIKHDGHHFQMDKTGKDTYKFKLAGAKNVFINDSSKYCIQVEEKTNIFNLKPLFLDNDFVLIEGNKTSSIQKLVFIDSKCEILKLIDKNEISNIKGLIYENEEQLYLLKEKYSIPLFHRDDTIKISNFILNNFKKPKVKALILAGGKSKRMGQDKGALKYYDHFQTHYLHDQLSNYVDEVYVSIRKEQENEEHVKGLTQIHDSFPSYGPISAIMSAMEKDPRSAWLVVAIDLPYLDDVTLETLLIQRNHLKVATCFKNPEKGWPEPLCTIWEPKSKMKLHQFFAQERFCPRKILFNSEIKLLELQNIQALNNCNTEMDYKNAIHFLETRGEYAKS